MKCVHKKKENISKEKRLYLMTRLSFQRIQDSNFVDEKKKTLNFSLYRNEKL